jgi:hypothetical protein
MTLPSTSTSTLTGIAPDNRFALALAGYSGRARCFTRPINTPASTICPGKVPCSRRFTGRIERIRDGHFYFRRLAILEWRLELDLARRIHYGVTDLLHPRIAKIRAWSVWAPSLKNFHLALLVDLDPHSDGPAVTQLSRFRRVHRVWIGDHPGRNLCGQTGRRGQRNNYEKKKRSHLYIN